MGKPFQKEIDFLPSTWQWATKIDVSEISKVIAKIATKPLIIVGSGGSLTGAHLVAGLHRWFTGNVANAMTPLEALNCDPGLQFNKNYLLFSAGGNNIDILKAFQQLVIREPQYFNQVIFASNSRLERQSFKYRYANTLTFTPPAGRDGFLATNSLLAFCILLTRAYFEVFTPDEKLPAYVTDSSPFRRYGEQWMVKLQSKCSPLWERDNLIVLHSTSLQPAAWDLESKFTEAALGGIQLADFRHFAHGRHHWLAKRGECAAVLALIHRSDNELAKKTLELLPRDIPVLRIPFYGNRFIASLSALNIGIHITHAAGLAKGIDPGRPGVPKFGRDIYHLRFQQNNDESLKSFENLVIARKVKQSEDVLIDNVQKVFWQNSLANFICRLEKAKFHSIVFDYDGTLCDECDKKNGLHSSVINEMLKILSAQIPIGIATGRGKSVRADLRKAFPKKFWDQIIIGYYNGSQIAELSSNNFPKRLMVCDELTSIESLFRKDKRLSKLAEPIEVRGRQITIQPKANTPQHTISPIVEDYIEQVEEEGIRVVSSSHSIDVLAPGVSKVAVISTLREIFLIDEAAPILTIGDRGSTSGNDYDLLSTDYSLSVDRVSQASNACWNLAPAGYRGAQAAISYLKALSIKENRFRFQIKKIAKRVHLDKPS